MTIDFTVGDSIKYKAVIQGNTIKINELQLFLEDWRTMKEKAEKWDKYTLNGQNITPEIIEAIREAEQKLEAIKKIAFDEEYEDDPYVGEARALEGIKKVLEKKE